MESEIVNHILIIEICLNICKYINKLDEFKIKDVRYLFSLIS